MEMLIAVVLISLLIGLAMFSFKHLLLTMKKTDFTGINKVLKFNQIRTSIQSIMYYVVKDYDKLNKNNSNNLHYYFNGIKNEIKYITNNPIFSKDIAVVKLSCLDKSLIYQEEPLYERIDFLKPNVLAESRQIAIYKDLEICEIEYFIEDKKFEALTNKIPTAINIKIKNNKQSIELYTNIKSDYTKSKAIINEKIYIPFL